MTLSFTKIDKQISWEISLISGDKINVVNELIFPLTKRHEYYHSCKPAVSPPWIKYYTPPNEREKLFPQTKYLIESVFIMYSVFLPIYTEYYDGMCQIFLLFCP